MPGYPQQNFFFGRFQQQDDYLVQRLRLNMSFAASEQARVITRFDLARAWWGVDNETANGGGQSGLFDDCGYQFFPGKGAPYLINGADTWNDPARELRTTIAYKF